MSSCPWIRRDRDDKARVRQQREKLKAEMKAKRRKLMGGEMDDAPQLLVSVVKEDRDDEDDIDQGDNNMPIAPSRLDRKRNRQSKPGNQDFIH